MTKISKLRICDWALILLLIAVLASSIQLEACATCSAAWVWCHVVIALLFMFAIGWHLFLHFQWRNWCKLITKQKLSVTRWLAVFYVLTAASAIITLVHWRTTLSHSPIGGVHGKIGFILIVLCICHTVKRAKSPILKTRK